MRSVFSGLGGGDYGSLYSDKEFVGDLVNLCILKQIQQEKKSEGLIVDFRIS